MHQVRQNKELRFETLTFLHFCDVFNELLYVVIVIQLHNHELLLGVKLSHEEWLPFVFVLALFIFLELIHLFCLLAHSKALHELFVRGVFPFAAVVVHVVLHAAESR